MKERERGNETVGEERGRREGKGADGRRVRRVRRVRGGGDAGGRAGDREEEGEGGMTTLLLTAKNGQLEDIPIQQKNSEDTERKKRREEVNWPARTPSAFCLLVPVHQCPWSRGSRKRALLASFFTSVSQPSSLFLSSFSLYLSSLLHSPTSLLCTLCTN